MIFPHKHNILPNKSVLVHTLSWCIVVDAYGIDQWRVSEGKKEYVCSISIDAVLKSVLGQG